LHVGIRVPHIPPSASLAHFLERVVAGGVDSLWWGDHLMSFSAPELWQGSTKVPSQLSLHTYVDPYVVMAWCADIIGTIAVGTCVTDAVRRMPATLAQTALTLTHVLQGKVILGLGAMPFS
jgi:phthiodiolone/phenolphthiodiolone dimycocerosates ketoreductase